jgi:broad specificity phosphatase PhoE
VTVLLARHGRTAANAAGRFQGRLDVPLDAEGERQAQALAQAIAARGDVGRVVASPLRRAHATAAAVAGRLGLAGDVDARRAEGDTGAWAGGAHADVQAEDPDGFAAFRRLQRGFAPPGGETFADVERRMVAALADVRAAGGVVLLVSHTNAIRVLLRAERGEAPPHGGIVNGIAYEL